MKRAVGYCEDKECEEFAKGVFLLNHGDRFYCPRCRHMGSVVPETGSYTGTSEVFKEVAVDFNYDPILGIYRNKAIVRDESLWGTHNIYTLCSPLIKTDKRALKVGEAILSNLNRYQGLLTNGEIPRTNDFVISFDDDREKFSHKLGLLQEHWTQAGLAEKKAIERAT